MPGITICPEAVDDLSGVVSYFALHSPTAAERWLDGVDGLLALIAAQPHMGESIDHLNPGLRRFVCGQYLLFYKPHDDGITLFRVLHGARKIEDLFD